MTLQRIYLVPYNSVETVQNTYDHHVFDAAGVPGGTNNNGAEATHARIKSFYIMIDQEKIHQDFDIEIAKNHDYNLLKERLKGSLILNSNMYYYNWFWMDDFTALKTASEKTNKDIDIVQGLDLSVERKWDFLAQTNGTSITYYTFAICQRPMLINHEGIFWE